MRSQSQHYAHRAVDVIAVAGPSRSCNGRLRPFALALIGLLLLAATPTTTAKSLYVIAERLDANMQVPCLVCGIGSDGKLTRQGSQIVPLHGAGAVGLALDPDSGLLFLTYLTSNVIEVLDAATLETVATTAVKGAHSLEAVVYDKGKGFLYCADRGTANLYVYQWAAATRELMPVPGSPVRLDGAEVCGLALDEVAEELYVGSISTSVNVYSTLDWRWVRTISVGRVAASVAVDPVRKYLYYGGGFFENYFLGRHDLSTGQEKEVELSTLVGVIGLAVDQSNGYVYISTGSENCYCGHDLLVFSSSLTLIDAQRNIGLIGDPGALVLSDGMPSFGPLHLTKTVKTATGDQADSNDLPQVLAGDELTYTICFDHDDLPLTDIAVVDTLPAELAFVRATGNALYGRYDAVHHTYTWLNPPLIAGTPACLEIVCRVEPNTPADQHIVNSVSIDSRETPLTTTRATVITVVPKVFQPLRVSKMVLAGATGDGLTTSASIHAGDEVTYRISFNNKDNAAPAENVRVTDNLPPQAVLVRATGDGLFGEYEPLTHTYTWTYRQLAPGESNSVDVVLRFSQDVTGGATIANTATIASDNTPAARASVDVKVAAFAPLRLQKTLVSGSVGQPDSRGRSYVETGSTITYALTFSNPATNQTATQISIVDTLPPEVTFVRADGDRDFGFYDPNTHTYTWRYGSLAPGLEQTLNLVVRVNDRLDPNTVITNSASLNNKQTVLSTRINTEVVVRPVPVVYGPVRLLKTLARGAVGQPDSKGRSYVEAGSTVTYAISFSNPSTNQPVLQISVVDRLPREVTFVTADGDRDFGSYDPNTHTYTWRFASLDSGAEKSVNLTVRMNDRLDPNTLITNAATISTGQTSSATVGVESIVRGIPTPPVTEVKGMMYIKPDHIYRNNSTTKSDLMVVVHLPEGIGMTMISTTPLVLTPGNVKATGQQIFGTSSQGKVLCFFAVDPILAATQGYGEFPLKVTGRLNDGRFFVCDGTIWILKFGGP